MDIDTFGGSKASVTLVEMLREVGNKKLTAKCSRLLVSYNRGIREITNIADTKIRNDIRRLWRDDFIKRIDMIVGCPEDIKCFLRNMLASKFRSTRFIGISYLDIEDRIKWVRNKAGHKRKFPNKEAARQFIRNHKYEYTRDETLTVELVDINNKEL